MTIEKLEVEVRTKRAELAEAEYRFACAVSIHNTAKETNAVRGYLNAQFDPDSNYADSIAFHYDIRACIADRLGFDEYKASLRETNLSRTVATLARTITGLTGEKWDRR